MKKLPQVLINLNAELSHQNWRIETQQGERPWVLIHRNADHRLDVKLDFTLLELLLIHVDQFILKPFQIFPETEVSPDIHDLWLESIAKEDHAQ